MTPFLAPQFPAQTKKGVAIGSHVFHTWIHSCRPTSYILQYKRTSLKSMKPHTLQSAALAGQNSSEE